MYKIDYFQGYQNSLPVFFHPLTQFLFVRLFWSGLFQERKITLWKVWPMLKISFALDLEIDHLDDNGFFSSVLAAILFFVSSAVIIIIIIIIIPHLVLAGSGDSEWDSNGQVILGF